MLKRNSIFIRVLIPVTIVMMIQICLISAVLFITGTIKSLEDGSIETLRKNVEYRSVSLENFMVYYMSNLEKSESDIEAAIDEYLHGNNIRLDEVLGNYEHETGILYEISNSLVEALKHNTTTGIFFYFSDVENFSESKQSYNGLYYRNLDPIIMSSDNSNILFLKGYVDIARKDKIQLDSLWSEAFVFSPEDECVWRSLKNPILAALENPELSVNNLSYWNTPHLINPNSPVDSNECITYTRPFFYNGRQIGIIGTEMQVEQLKKYFPANDFDSSSKSGYMLLKYKTSEVNTEEPNAEINFDIFAVTGSYVKRIFGSKNTATFKTSETDNVYTVSDSDIEAVHMAIKPLHLYNANAPFSDEQWALASVGADSMMFNSSRLLQNGIIYSSTIAFLVGVILIYFIVRISTRPLISIVNQIEESDPDNTKVISESNTYEIALLSSTINAMNNKRKRIETALREERERYLIALESATDTFTEYDVTGDSFMIYIFSAGEQKPELISNVINSFTDKTYAGEICHPDDIQSLIGLTTAIITNTIEIRFKASLFSHISDIDPDEGYHWFQLKASRIFDENGKIIKIIGTARQITGEKLEAIAKAEASRRDTTTGFYNFDYGMNLLRIKIFDAETAKKPIAVCIVHVDDFDAFEAYYGRVFSGAILMLLSRKLHSITVPIDAGIRINNDEFLLFFEDMSKNEFEEVVKQIHDISKCLYAGENPDLKLTLSIGTAACDGGKGYGQILNRVGQAIRYSLKNGRGRVEHFNKLPHADRFGEAYRFEKPIGVSIEISKEDTVGFIFDMFERTADIPSAINMVLAVLGDIYSLDRIIICSFDADFNSNWISYQWCSHGTEPYNTKIYKLSQDIPADFERMLDENGTIFYSGETIKDCEEGVRILLHDAPQESYVAYCCVMYESGEQIGRIIYRSNIGDRKPTEEELISLYEISKIISAHVSIEKSNSASRAKSEFLSRMSHEIRTPMNAIIGMTAIAKESVRNPERISDCLGKIDFSAKHLLELINDVLEMSRIESGKLQIENEDFSLADFVSALDILMRPQIEEKEICFSIIRDSKHNIIIGDEYRLRQVLVNLLGNAGKFTPRGGKITLRVEETGSEDGIFGFFRFSVKDTGIGISKEDQPSVFKSFEQATSGNVKRHDGTGLGLAISSNIISAMGGKIELTSNLGEGSEFFFTLKMKYGSKDIMQDVQVEETSDYGEFFKGKKILLVEDNEINIEIATYILEEERLTVDVARNGREAVEMFLTSEVGYYDAIIMDIHMPVMDGLTATRKIRKSIRRADSQTVPIIAMTADAFDEDMKKSIESGMNGHIAKPVDGEKLYSLLNKCLREVRNEKEQG